MASFPESLWAEIREEFGEHCLRRGDYKKANENFRESLQHEENKLDSVYRLTNSQAREANLDSALELLKEKSRLANFKNHFNCNLQECDCNYEKNLFEKSFLLISEKARHIQNAVVEIPHATDTMMKKQNEAQKKGPKVAALNNRFEMIRTNFDDMIGKNAGNCLYNQRKYFDKIMHSWKPDVMSSVAPAKSKILLTSDECDVVSVLEENVQHKSAKEKHRVEHLKRIFAQRYMQSAWKDFEFINELKANKILSKSNQNAESFDIINREIDDCVQKTGAMIQQLHARCPLYTFTHKTFPDVKQKEKANRISKFRMQYQTRRDMFTALEAMHECRARGKLEKLIKIAEQELGVHFHVKSDKLMPRKKEFTAEICNLIGLAHLDKLKMPKKRARLSDLELLAVILDVSVADRNVAVPYKFGDQSTYRDPAEPDTSFLVFKQNINRLDERLKYSTMAIEKCHLYHEMGKQNLKQNTFDETRSFARKIIDEAHDASSYLWEFLGQILMCRADVMQKNFVKINDSFESAKKMVDVFGSPELSDVIGSCFEISEGMLRGN